MNYIQPIKLFHNKMEITIILIITVKILCSNSSSSKNNQMKKNKNSLKVAYHAWYSIYY